LAAGCSVEQVVAYRSVDVATPDPEVAAMLQQGRIDWITVTSSAVARSLVRMFGDDLRRAKLASISPITSDTLRQQGHEPAAEAREYTMEGVVAAILNASPNG
jgi:uroporphyrinogen III methyltransferase/synthase